MKLSFPREKKSSSVSTQKNRYNSVHHCPQKTPLSVCVAVCSGDRRNTNPASPCRSDSGNGDLRLGMKLGTDLNHSVSIQTYIFWKASCFRIRTGSAAPPFNRKRKPCLVFPRARPRFLASQSKSCQCFLIQILFCIKRAIPARPQTTHFTARS
jgi:hypothetical protein